MREKINSGVYICGSLVVENADGNSKWGTEALVSI